LLEHTAEIETHKVMQMFPSLTITDPPMFFSNGISKLMDAHGRPLFIYEGAVPFLAHVVVTDDFNFTFDLLFKKDAKQSDDFRKTAKSSKTN